MNRTVTLTPIDRFKLDDDDPRERLGDNALALASRNGFPIVASRVARKDGMGLAAGGAVALLLGGLTFWSMGSHRSAPPGLSTSVAAQPERAPAAAPLVSVPAPASRSAPLPATTPAPAPTVDHAHAPVMVFDMSTMPSSVAAPVPRGAPPTVAPKNLAGLGENETFASRVGDAGVETASATRMADPTNTISQGTMIAAVLETAIDSDLPGYVRAVVSQDVRSFDGSRVLIPRSSRLIGQYKSGLAAGQTRAYVMWTRLLRPDGVSVALASPAIDFAGRSGLTGKVDGHFMKRFGSAILLSVVGGLGALGSSGTSVVLSSSGTSAASVAAQRDASIPPTIRVRQGEPIRIFTARDLDFTTVAVGSEAAP